MICTVYGVGTIVESTVYKWLVRFMIGNFNLEDQKRSGGPAVVDDDQIEILIKNNTGYGTREIAEIFHISHMIALSHLKNTLARKSIRCLGTL